MAKKLNAIWNILDICLINPRSIVRKLKTLLNNYQSEAKKKGRSSTASEFLDNIDDVFYIGKCKCPKATPCHCGLIPPELQEFMVDQHSARKLTIPEYVLSTTEQLSTLPPASADLTYEPSSSYMH